MRRDGRVCGGRLTPIEESGKLIRDHLFNKKAASDPLFRWRGGETSRIEALSDAVFAFALTLLVVSLGVPQNFYQVWLSIRDFPAFAMSFAILIMCWYHHYLFFRRYGLEDFLTMIINTMILFLTLFYVYPLKFLATLLWRQMLGDDVSNLFAVPENPAIATLPGSQGFWLMIFYNAGVIGIFGLYMLLKLHALSKRKQLELDEVELILTRGAISIDAVMVCVGIVSILLAFVSPPLSGLIYFVLGPVQGFLGFRYGNRAEKVFNELELSEERASFQSSPKSPDNSCDANETSKGEVGKGLPGKDEGESPAKLDDSES